MRELFLTEGESTRTSLVFHTEGEGYAVESFFLAVDDNLRDLLREVVEEQPESEANLGSDGVSHRDEDVADQPAASEDATAAEASEHSEASDSASNSDEEADKAPEQSGTPAGGASAGGAHAAQRGSLPTPDPRRTAPMSMRPREIQERIRGGATAAELAEEMGVTEARVEPFAHPVLLERQRMAELAKQTHPVREDGPARLTLWEVLATAFAARNNSLADAQWDSYRDTGGQWVIRVSWTAGHSENVAEWTFHNHHTSSPTAIPRNALAADLTDPEFAQPAGRTLSAVGRDRLESFGREDESDTEAPTGVGPAHKNGLRALSNDADAPHSPATQDPHGQDSAATDPGVNASGHQGRGGVAPQELHGESTEQGSDDAKDEFLQHPDPEQEPRPSKRRRRAVTPHWEDVLLGVRTNTKRPRN